MKSITEEMCFRQRLCEYAIKHGVTRAAKRYHTNRQFKQYIKYKLAAGVIELRRTLHHYLSEKCFA